MKQKLSDLLWPAWDRRRRRLVRHYFYISVILISGGLITSGLLELYFRYHESWKHFSLLQKEVVDGAAFKVQQYVEDIERTMKTVARGHEITQKGLSLDYTLQIEKLFVMAPPISEAVAFDANGIERGAVSRLQPILPHVRKGRNPKAFQKVKQGKSYFSPVYFAWESEPYMTIAVPIERFVGEVIGVLQAEVNLKYIWEIISNIKVGEAGYAYVVTRSGNLVAHPDISLALQRRNLAQLDQVKAAFQATTDATQIKGLVTYNSQDEKVFSSHALIPRLNWAVISEVPAKEIYTSLYASLLRTSSLLLIGISVALLATVFVGRRVVRPLEMLRQEVKRIRGGDLTSRLELHTGDEIQALSDEFNEMAASLKEAYTGLERKVAERTQELVTANQKLEEVSKHKSQFLANVNHELRTPISAIISSARLVLRKTERQIPQLQKENLQGLLNTAEHLLGLINSLLDLAKIEAGLMEVRVQPVEVHEMISGATSTVEPMLQPDRVRLIRQVDSGIPTFNTDREKLRQIILNLLGNAVKFTEQGEIKVSASQQNGFLKLAVSDTGIGIPKGELNRIFEEFHRADTSSTAAHTGTGLGLAIVQRFVNLLGGKIGVVSEVGKGSTFTVTLPLDRRESA